MRHFRAATGQPSGPLALGVLDAAVLGVAKDVAADVAEMRSCRDGRATDHAGTLR